MEPASGNSAGSERPVTRPLPQPTLATEPFWQSGRDGVLRIAQCLTCERRIQPPLPICPSCRGRKIEMNPVSGRATVVGFSVNHQYWLPAFPPPYVVAVVALDEDDRARLTTNIVGCPPGDVHIGMRVRVLFEQAEEVWIPLFEPDPDAGAQPGPVPEPRNYRAALRPMVTSRKFEDKVALTGVGQSRIGRRLMVDPLSLTVDAALAAIEDAGLTTDDIDGLSTYPGGTGGGMSEGGVTAVEEALAIRPTWLNGGGEVPGQIGSISTAMLAVAAGLCRHVLCFRTVWQASETAMQRSGRIHPVQGRASGMLEFRAPFGAVSAAQWIGVQASHYLHRYRAGRELLGAIAVNARTNAGRNAEALYRDPITMDDYLSARMVTTPFGLLDCDVPIDGAVAVIVSAVETAKDRPKPAVLVEATGTQVLERLSWDQDTLTHLPQSLGPAAHLWTRTSLRPDDVDIAELYDGFTFNCVSWLEALGFCGFGEAPDFIDGGRTIALDGRLPLNTHGGQLSAGRTHGYGFVREAMLQLRGEAAGRQVDSARVAVVTAGGGVPAGAMLLRRSD
ncbi:OB-fold domain-containing protein [Amycolatopsis ultiminotia]|uniref:OB-fold domain-containing protein n=1 Tax=Amycolatopsis ultiminotia TaxID=543629 RepID=A0ABP6V4F7_9PSEU